MNLTPVDTDTSLPCACTQGSHLFQQAYSDGLVSPCLREAPNTAQSQGVFGLKRLYGVVRRNSIVLPSTFNKTKNYSNSYWLGQYSSRDKVRRSGLWNNHHVDENSEPGFLMDFNDLTSTMRVLA